jgi:hypothetical protein
MVQTYTIACPPSFDDLFLPIYLSFFLNEIFHHEPIVLLFQSRIALLPFGLDSLSKPLPPHLSNEDGHP